MTDVLLAHSYFLHFDPKQWKLMQPYAPLGTLYAASYLRSNGYTVALFDAMLKEHTNDLIVTLERHQPRILVLYEDSFNWLSKMCLTRMREACFDMIRLAKKQGGSSLPVIVAGSDPTDHQHMYFDHGADFVIVGEGEITLHQLVEKLLRETGTGVKQTAGIAFREDGVVRLTAQRGFQNLDGLPFPAWDLVDVEAYQRAWRRRHGYYSVNLVTTRGCPFRCNWCAKPIYGDRYNTRSPASVVEEMVWLRRTLRPDHLWFADDIFGLKPGWIEKFSEAVRSAGVVTPFKIQARVDLLHDDAVAALKKAGCKTVWVGAESGSQRILDAMDKGTTIEQIYAVTNRLRHYGIEICFFLQFGYPGETDADIEKTRKMVRDCQPDDIGISVSYPLPGTRFHERIRNTMGEKQNWEHSDDLDMMFYGQYQPAFYKQLHRVVHQEFRMKKAATLASNVWRDPSQWTTQSVRRLLGATARLPKFYLDRVRLSLSRIPNRRLS